MAGSDDDGFITYDAYKRMVSNNPSMVTHMSLDISHLIREAMRE